MGETLATKYRPQEFSDLVGQDLNAEVLTRVVKDKRIPPGFLFSGPSGTGKTSAARILANELCGDGVIEVDAASTRGVDAIRELAAALRYSTGYEFRVAILDEAHNLTREAFNALLKTLEEPPQGSVFVLVTTSPQDIPETVRDRLLEFEFKSVSTADVLRRVTEVAYEEVIGVEENLLEAIAYKAGGSVRRALMLLDHVALAKVSTLAGFEELTGDRDYSVALMEKILSGNFDEVERLVQTILSVIPSVKLIQSQLTDLLVDFLVIRSGGDRNKADWGERKRLAYGVSLSATLSALQLLWDLRTRLRSSGHDQTDLGLAIALMTDLISSENGEVSEVVSQVSSEEQDATEEKMSLSDLQRTV